MAEQSKEPDKYKGFTRLSPVDTSVMMHGGWVPSGRLAIEQRSGDGLITLLELDVYSDIRIFYKPD